MVPFRSQVIRLAYHNPKIRNYLLPLLKESSSDNFDTLTQALDYLSKVSVLLGKVGRDSIDRELTRDLSVAIRQLAAIRTSVSDIQDGLGPRGTYMKGTKPEFGTKMAQTPIDPERMQSSYDLVHKGIRSFLDSSRAVDLAVSNEGWGSEKVASPLWKFITEGERMYAAFKDLKIQLMRSGRMG